MGAMKNEFLIAITQIAAEKNLPKEVVLQAVETALVSAYKKDSEATGNIAVRIDRNTGNVHVYAQRAVVEEVEDPRVDISLEEARRVKPDAQLGDIIENEVTPANAGRIAAQTAKQVVLQRLREAEREMVYEEFSNREGDIVSGIIQRVDARQVIVDLGKTEGILPPTEQVRAAAEHYRPGLRMKFYLVEVHKAARGPQLILSRTHKNLLKRLFELEVPEIYKGIVEIKSIAREPGYRSKVAVFTQQPGVDPVGSCVGLRGIRIQNIVNELNGERIDVVQWDPEPTRFVANALSPAQVAGVSTNEEDNTASVMVPDRQLSLAIGKEGQNARLAAKLTGWRIDIKSESAVQELRLAAVVEEAPAAAPAEAPAPEPREEQVIEAPAETLAAEVAPTEEAAVAEEAAPEPVAVAEEVPAAPAKPQIRFAEDLVGVVTAASPPKGKRAKARKPGKGEEPPPAAKAKKIKKARRPVLEEELEEEEPGPDQLDYSENSSSEET